MQVTSLLVSKPDSVGSRRRWWKTKDYIDIKEIKPNPIIAWLKSVRWLRIFAIVIQRIGRCMDRTEPGPMMLAGVGIMLGIMFTAMPWSFREPTPTFMQGFWHATWFSTFLVVLFETILYLWWEFIQLCKWLHAWANRTHPNPYEK
jgi:hypothetical protein